MTKKKKSKPQRNSVFALIMNESDFVGNFKDMSEIFDYCEKESLSPEDVLILEVIRGFEIYYPEEPEYETIEKTLDELL